MNDKATLLDLTNADLVDDLTRRCRELRADLEAAAVREAELRRALTEAMEKVVDSFGVAYDAVDIDRWESVLADPSLQAEALTRLAVASLAVQAARKAYKKMLELGVFASIVPDQAVSEETNRANAEWEAAVDAYQALRDSMPLGYGHADGGAG